MSDSMQSNDCFAENLDSLHIPDDIENNFLLEDFTGIFNEG